jgi:hypothetical protein
VKHSAIGFSSIAFPLTLVLAGVLAAQSAPSRKDIPTIAKAANGAIVSIITSGKDGKPVAQGSGFLVSTDGRIVTNYHVIKGASSAIVKLPDGAFYDVDGAVAVDKVRDLAVIKSHGQNFRVVTLGNSDRVQVGEEIIAIGSPLSLESTVSSGIVSSIRTIEDEGGKFLQVTAPISPGSSGGPLFNMAGEVVGITTLFLKGGENLNFAIPINDAKRLLLAHSKVQPFPVETSDPLADLGTPAKPNPEAAPSVSPTTARAFYKQFYDAGQIDGRIIPTFVCFDDDPKHSQNFFTFQVRAYNSEYAKAVNDHGEILKSTVKKDANGHVVGYYGDAEQVARDAQALQTMRSIEASEPDVYFLDEDMLDMLDFGDLFVVNWEKDNKEYLRSGGRVLFLYPYLKGIAPNRGMVYRSIGPGNGSSWVAENPPPEKTNLKTDENHFRFEPITNRYQMTFALTFTDGTSSYGDAGSGICEKVPPKQSN